MGASIRAVALVIPELTDTNCSSSLPARSGSGGGRLRSVSGRAHFAIIEATRSLLELTEQRPEGVRN